MIKKMLALVISIAIIVAIIVYAVIFIWGKDGLVTKATVGEVEWNKHEVIEEINILLKPIYVEAHNASVESGRSIDEFYNPNTIIIKLIEKNVIEPYKNIEGTVVENKYHIIVESLKGDISEYGKGENGSEKDIFVIEWGDNGYAINYYDVEGELQNIGPLEVVQEI